VLNISVLLIEDNDGDARLVERRLGVARRLQCSVERASWMSSALTLLKNKRYDIILLDLTLPDSHGIDSVVGVKREAPDVPIIVLSGQEDLGVATRALEAGADSFIVKSAELSTDALERDVLYALERSRREKVSKELIHRSIGRLTHDFSTPVPPAANGLLAEHINVVDTTMQVVLRFLERSYPEAAENVEHILREHGYHVVMQEMRSLLRMDNHIRASTARKITDRALDALKAASSEPVMNPEYELLRIIGSPLGDSDG